MKGGKMGSVTQTQTHTHTHTQIIIYRCLNILLRLTGIQIHVRTVEFWYCQTWTNISSRVSLGIEGIYFIEGFPYIGQKYNIQYCCKEVFNPKKICCGPWLRNWGNAKEKLRCLFTVAWGSGPRCGVFCYRALSNTLHDKESNSISRLVGMNTGPRPKMALLHFLLIYSLN